MTKLNPRGKYIINAYFGLDGNKPKTLEEIGKEMGNLSKERIRQLKEKNLLSDRKEIGKVEFLNSSGNTEIEERLFKER